LNEARIASGFVFPAEDGRHHARTILRDPFNRIREAAGITKHFTPHGCRRTASALYRRVAGSAAAMAVVEHTTNAMHLHYAFIEARRRRARPRGKAFKVLEGGVTDRSPPGSGGDHEGATG
jgi:integrase